MTGEKSKRQRAKDILMKYVHMIPYAHFPQAIAVDIENVVDCLIDAAIEEIKQSQCLCDCKE